MKETTIKKKKGFQVQKGQSANPAGKPKGAYSYATCKFMELKEKASLKGEDAFKLLWKAMEDQKPWAFDIYWNKLYSVPKDFDEAKIRLGNNDGTIDGQIAAITAAMPQLDELTPDHTIDRLKCLMELKNGATAVATNIMAQKETRDSLMEKISMISKVIDHVKEI